MLITINIGLHLASLLKNLSHPSQVFYKLPRTSEHLCSGQHLDGVFFRNNVESSKLKNEYSNIRGQNKKK